MIREENSELYLNDNFFEMYWKIANGMSFIHSQNIIHRDLSSNNILISKGLIPKISDLGSAGGEEMTSISSKSAGGMKGKVPYTAPEIFLADIGVNVYTIRSDVFSYGVMLFEGIVKGNSSWFNDIKKEKVQEMIKTNQRPEIPTNTGMNYFIPLIEECWDQV